MHFKCKFYFKKSKKKIENKYWIELDLNLKKRQEKHTTKTRIQEHPVKLKVMWFNRLTK